MDIGENKTKPRSPTVHWMVGPRKEYSFLLTSAHPAPSTGGTQKTRKKMSVLNGWTRPSSGDGQFRGEGSRYSL